MVDRWLTDYLANLLFLDIPLLCYYINLRSSIIFCLSSGDIYLSLGISSLLSLSTLISELFCGEVFENFVILTVILLLIKLLVIYAFF